MFRTGVVIALLGSISVAAMNRPGVGRAVPEPGFQAELRVAAAADLARALDDMAKEFEQETGIKVTVVLGSTGLLARQIENGAPFDLFMAADERYVLDLEKAGKIEQGSRRLYAIGRLAIWTPASRERPTALHDLAGERFGRIAIANPQHAPYGRAAMAAFEKAGIRKSVEPKLVFGENVQQALRYAESGSADAAIVSLSLVTGAAGQCVEVAQSLYPPIRQALGVVTASANRTAARRLAGFITGPSGRAYLRRHGFGLPQPPKTR